MTSTSILPPSPALLVIDMQNGTSHPSGSFSKAHLPITSHTALIPAIQKLQTAFRTAQLPILYTAFSFSPSLSNAGLLASDLPILGTLNAFEKGSWDAAIVDELAPDLKSGREEVVEKVRYTAFWEGDGGKGLESVLKEKGVGGLVVVGAGTNVCVESTVRDAYVRGIRCLVVEDATGSTSNEDYEAGIRSLRWFAGLKKVEEVVGAVEGLGKGV